MASKEENPDSVPPPPSTVSTGTAIQTPVAAPPRPAGVPCVVQVRIDVAQRNWEDFERLGVTFHPIFGRAGLDLAFAMYGAPYMKDGELYYVAYNYWSVDRDLNRFVNASLVLPDNPGFGQLDEVLSLEVKNIVIPIGPSVPRAPVLAAASGGWGDPKVPRRNYVRIVSSLESKDAAEYQFRVDTFLPAFAAKAGWSLGQSYLFLTGADETVVQLWQVPSALTMEQVLETLQTTAIGGKDDPKGAPWMSLIKIQSIEVLTSTSFDT